MAEEKERVCPICTGASVLRVEQKVIGNYALDFEQWYCATCDKGLMTVAQAAAVSMQLAEKMRAASPFNRSVKAERMLEKAATALGNAINNADRRRVGDKPVVLDKLSDFEEEE